MEGEKKMKRAISIFLVLVLMFSLCLTGCNGTTSTAGGSQATASGAAPSGEPIRIGFEGWSSGADAYMGQVAEAILQDYIDDVNANGGWLGRPVELVAYDISKDFSESINATNRLINQDKVVAIIGPDGSPFAIPLGDIVAEAKVPLLPYGSNSLVTVNEDGSVNWLPVCADAHGFVVNKALFEKYMCSVPAQWILTALPCWLHMLIRRWAYARWRHS